MQTNGSVFVEKIEQFEKINYELQLTKIVGCFLGFYVNNFQNKIFINKAFFGDLKIIRVRF